MKTIAASLTLLLFAGCGVDWFPSNTVFRNNSTAFTPTSTAKRMLFATGNYSTANQPLFPNQPH